MKWLSADYHLGEDRFELMGRPFTTSEEMIDLLVFNHNKLVKPDDEVYLVGDVCYNKRPEYLHHIDRFNGIKTLIRGNHDRDISDEEFSKHFVKIVPEGEGIDLDIEGVHCYITHYPSTGRADRFNLVGHIHAAWKYQLNSLNIGIDVHHFRPVNFDRIPFHLKAISAYYDDDVWIAYSQINELYKGLRGKKGTYLETFKNGL